MMEWGIEKCRVTSSDFFDGWGKENYVGVTKLNAIVVTVDGQFLLLVVL